MTWLERKGASSTLAGITIVERDALAVGETEVKYEVEEITIGSRSVVLTGKAFLDTAPNVKEGVKIELSKETLVHFPTDC